jgi:hypothetical protein
MFTFLGCVKISKLKPENLNGIFQRIQHVGPPKSEKNKLYLNFRNNIHIRLFDYLNNTHWLPPTKRTSPRAVIKTAIFEKAPSPYNIPFEIF